VTAAQIVADGLYVIIVHDPERYIRLNITVAGNVVPASVVLVTSDEQRRPVTQPTAVQPALVYGAGRTPKVAVI
jgi:hypothetical protein